jgi:hypothetical protein
MEKKMIEKREHPRAYRETLFLLKIQMGFDPPARQSIHVAIYEHGLQKRPSRNIFVFQQAEFLCWVKRKSPPNRLFKSELEKRGFFTQTINDATCSNRIIHYLSKE